MKVLIHNTKALLHNTKGETLVEVIVSVVLVLASVGVFATAAATAGRINAKVAEMDQRMYDAIADAEGRTVPVPPNLGEIRIQDSEGDILDITVNISIYGTDMKAFSYNGGGS